MAVSGSTPPIGTLSLKARALRWLAQREHSRAELQRKLARSMAPQAMPALAGQIVALLDELEQKGFLNEQRAAESLLAAKSSRLGTHRLRQIMQARGLPAGLISATLQQAQTSELTRATEIWRRKFGTPARDAAGRAKQVRFLLGRGFGSDIVRQVVKGCDDDA